MDGDVKGARGSTRRRCEFEFAIVSVEVKPEFAVAGAATATTKQGHDGLSGAMSTGGARPKLQLTRALKVSRAQNKKNAMVDGDEEAGRWIRRAGCGGCFVARQARKQSRVGKKDTLNSFGRI